MSDVKLLPCPFCGREPVLTKMSGHGKEYQPCVSCESMECPVGPCTDGFASAEEASAAWNTRTTEHALTKGLLETIQQALVNQHWQTLGDVYRGKTLFLSQDLLNRIDSALDPKE